MILSQSCSLEIILSGAADTNQLQWTASFNEISSSCCGLINARKCSEGNESQGDTNDTNAVTMVSVPTEPDSAQEKIYREVVGASVNNTSAGIITATMQINNGSTTKIVFKAELMSGDQILYTND